MARSDGSDLATGGTPVERQQPATFPRPRRTHLDDEEPCAIRRQVAINAPWRARVTEGRSAVPRAGPRWTVTSPIWTVLPGWISENRTFRGSIHDRPEALASSRVGVPPETGTVHVSQDNPPALGSMAVYATRKPSALKVGASFGRGSSVSWTASPLGSIFT